MSPLMISVSGVRGIVGADFNPLEVARWTAALADLLGPGPVVLGRDSRTTGAVLAHAAASVLRACGRETWDLGIVPTPTVQLAVEHWKAAGGLILSASHNPAPWNALKFVDGDGGFLSPERFPELRRRAEVGIVPFVEAARYGGMCDRGSEALQLHREAILRAVDCEAIRSAGIRAAVDTGHGAGGVILPALATDLGVTLVCHRAEPSGELAANPEPSEDSLVDFLNVVDGSPAFVAMIDPDADRFAVALPGTTVVGEEWTLPLVVRSVLAGRAGPVVTNLSTSSRVEAAAARFGVVVTRTPVGEAHVVAGMRRVGAAIGGEGNGGVIDPAVHLGRDAAVAFARLCEAEALHPGGLRALAAEFPPRVMRKAKLSLPVGGMAALEPVLAGLLGEADDRRDGLRWSHSDGFVHIRASGTEPVVRAMVEAETAAAAGEIMERLRSALEGR
jgi:phosphomannomutase